MRISSLHFNLSLLLVLFLACGSGNNYEAEPKKMNAGFSEYWYAGKAELTSYHLKQARYGEIHEGKAVMVYVTEDFSKSKQVKLDRPAGADAVKILKLNLTKKFLTGIYPYSMMQSVFTPIDRKAFPRTMKVTTTSQEWCGHTFTQLNDQSTHYDVQSFSYFESESDESFEVKPEWLEDEVWTMIRINPDVLPTGEVQFLPGTMSSRLTHRPLKPVKAEASMEMEDDLRVYKLNYPTERRTLTIYFDKKFPYQIQKWTESYQSGWGANAKMLTTEATLMKSIKSDYWNRNGVKDAGLRKSLGL